MKRGFIPILIAIIIGVSVIGVSGYIGIEKYQSEQVQDNLSDSKIDNDIIENSVLINPIEVTVPIKTETQTDIKTTENPELKIAKCEANKQNSYDKSILKIDKATEDKLREIFDSLNQQYKDSVDKIYAETNINISRITNDSTLTGEMKTELIRDYNDSASEQINALYENQQTFWNNQKIEIENNKQNMIDQVNQLLNEEYSRCLNVYEKN